MDADKRKSKAKPSLADVYHFTDADLKVNRKGDISPRQLTRMDNELKSEVLVWGGVLFVILAIFILLFRLYPPVALVSVLTILGFLAVIIGRPLYNLRQDQQLGRVETVNGYVQLNTETTYTKRYHVEPVGRIRLYLYVGEERFELREKQFLAFNNEDFYSVYYLPYSRRILSVEQVKQNPFE